LYKSDPRAVNAAQHGPGARNYHRPGPFHYARYRRRHSGGELSVLERSNKHNGYD
jgi:hypothetical protein